MDSHTNTTTERKAKPVAPKVKELVASVKSVVLATIDKEGVPTSSYAPYVQDGKDFYILVSFMAKHTKNLLNGYASVMFIEDELATKQVYARERLTVETNTSEVERDSDLWVKIIAALKERHGKVVDIISEMKDFILVKLEPTKGSYVNGFGSAYYVDENLEILEHRNDVNHK